MLRTADRVRRMAAQISTVAASFWMCLKDPVRAYPGLRIDVATDVDQVLVGGLCVSGRHGQLRDAMGAQKGGVPSRQNAALDQPGFSGLQGFGIPVDLRWRRTARSAMRSMVRIRNCAVTVLQRRTWRPARKSSRNSRPEAADHRRHFLLWYSM